MPNRIEVRAAGILVRDKRVLLVEHKKPSESYWVVPGGRVCFGETLPDALRREFLEELAMRVRIGGLVFLNDAAPAGGSRHVVNVYFQVSSDDEPGELQDVEDARFFSEAEFREIDLRPSIEDVLTEIINCGSSENVYQGNLWP